MGEKTSLNLEKRYRLLVFKGKSCTCNNAEKHPRSCPNSVINSLEFSLFTVVFLQPFFLSSAFSFFRPPLFEFFFLLYTMVFALSLPSTCELGVWKFPCPISHLLKPSAISCKAAYLQFKHHLHINAARELVGKHLMWR